MLPVRARPPVQASSAAAQPPRLPLGSYPPRPGGARDTSPPLKPRTKALQPPLAVGLRHVSVDKRRSSATGAPRWSVSSHDRRPRVGTGGSAVRCLTGPARRARTRGAPVRAASAGPVRQNPNSHPGVKDHRRRLTRVGGPRVGVPPCVATPLPRQWGVLTARALPRARGLSPLDAPRDMPLPRLETRLRAAVGIRELWLLPHPPAFQAWQWWGPGGGGWRKILTAAAPRSLRPLPAASTGRPPVHPPGAPQPLPRRHSISRVRELERGPGRAPRVSTVAGSGGGVEATITGGAPFRITGV